MLVYNEEYIKTIEDAIRSLPGCEKLKGKRVFVTGGNGLVCSPLVDILHVLNSRHGYEIDIILGGRSKERIAKRFHYLTEGKDYSYVRFAGAAETKEASGGAEEESSLKGIDYFIHGAGTGDPVTIMSDPAGVMMANINGLKVLLDASRENKGSRILFVSSSEVYGKVPGVTSGLSEDDYGFIDILNPRSSYPSAKRASETLMASYIHEYGVDGVIGRPGHIYGPAITDTDTRVTAQFTRNAKNNEPIIMKSEGSQIRSYCYFLDCATGLLTILLQGGSGEAYNISNPEAICSIRDMAEGFSQVSGCPLELHIATPEEKAKFNQAENSSLDSEKLLALGWKPAYDRLKGIDATLEFYSED